MNQVPAEELTLSLFREAYPRELFKALRESGYTIEERFPGVYYILGNVLFDTQVVVTRRLSRETHSSLRILSRNDVICIETCAQAGWRFESICL